MTEPFSTMQDMFDILPDGVVVIDKSATIVCVNQQMGALFGYELQELVGMELNDLIPLRFREKHRHHVTQFFQDPAVRRMGEKLFLYGIGKDGTEFDVDISLSPIKFGREMMVLGIVRDISDKKNLERSLLKKNETLAIINAGLENFSYTISHDLKAPLANIQGIIHTMTRMLPHVLQEELQDYLQHLDESIHAMANLISGVSTYSSQAGQLGNTFEKIHLNEVITELNKLIRLPSHIELQISDNLPTIWGNRTKVTQILLNLITNAAKYNDKENGKIRISGCIEGTECILRIEDNGPGIPEELRETVFNLFNKGRSNRNDSQGIGLAIVKKYIQDHGGSASIGISELGGASFDLVLPAKEMVAKAIAE